MGAIDVTTFQFDFLLFPFQYKDELHAFFGDVLDEAGQFVFPFEGMAQVEVALLPEGPFELLDGNRLLGPKGADVQGVRAIERIDRIDDGIDEAAGLYDVFEGNGLLAIDDNLEGGGIFLQAERIKLIAFFPEGRSKFRPQFFFLFDSLSS